MLLPCKLTVKAIEAGQGKAAETEGGEMCKIWQNFCQKNLEYSALCPEALFANQWCFWKTQTLLARQLSSGEIDTEGSLTDMVGGYTALEGRWSRGRQVKHQHSPSQHFPINFLFQGLYGGQFLFAGHGMEVEDSEKHKRK